MKVLFVVANGFIAEPLGAMLLMAVCKKAGHEVILVDLIRFNLLQYVKEWNPDVIAYSAMTVNFRLFEEHDRQVWISV